MSISPLPLTWAISRIRRSSRLAIRGVPRERLASSFMDSSSMLTPNSFAERRMICTSSSGVYISNLLMIPNRSRSGAARLPARVVAPTRVNLFRSTRRVLAEGPLPMMISSAKSSIAEYSISSTVLWSRWISSMNNTSPSFRFVSTAARSPAFSIAGPEVILKSTPSSEAMIPANVVFPRPGGP